MKARSFGSVLFLFDSDRVGLVEPQDLSRPQRYLRLRIDNLFAIQLHAALFDQPAGLRAGFIYAEAL